MDRLVPLVIRPWMLPLIVAALALPIIGGFVVGGPPLGLATGAIAATVVLVLAARARFDEPIEVRRSADRRYRLLVVAGEPVDDPGLVERIAEIATQGRDVLDPEEPPEVLVLAPARLATLDRWASDLAGAREAAGRRLAVSVAALTAAGLEAEGSVGDSDPLQAIADELTTFAAREVVLVAGPELGSDEATELGRRLDRPVRLLEPQAKRPTSSP
jgi:hypothetical protein